MNDTNDGIEGYDFENKTNAYETIGGRRQRQRHRHNEEEQNGGKRKKTKKTRKSKKSKKTKKTKKTKKSGKTNKWIMHVKKYARDHNINYMEALKSSDCKKKYKNM